MDTQINYSLQEVHWALTNSSLNSSAGLRTNSWIKDYTGSVVKNIGFPLPVFILHLQEGGGMSG